jgi:hypothetical protein
MWEGSETPGQTTQDLLDRIAQLEKALAKLLEEKSSSLFFPQALHPTPRGIEVKSRSNSFTNELDTMNVFNTISRATSGSQMPDLNLNDEDISTKGDDFSSGSSKKQRKRRTLSPFLKLQMEQIYSLSIRI